MDEDFRLEQLKILERIYYDAKPQLQFDSPFELLVAVILSAQCTDKRVNEVTQILFPLANTPAKILALGIEQLEKIIKPCGLFHSKAKNITGTSKILLDEYGGEVPSDFDELLKLPGVGRKTANVVTSVAFNNPAIAVDTHVFRVANRTKIAEGKTPQEVELGLQKIIPREKWSAAHHWLIFHGRIICHARKPECNICALAFLCPSSQATDI
ncbi:MAG: endonuclease III [Selenomonadaceae bacterium]|nr:endonuclease III [Selenomonadaceae bacterium]